MVSRSFLPYLEPLGILTVIPLEEVDGSMKAHYCDRKLQPPETAVCVVPRNQKLSGTLCFTPELLREPTRK